MGDTRYEVMQKYIMTAIFILGFDCCERFRTRVYNLG